MLADHADRWIAQSGTFGTFEFWHPGVLGHWHFGTLALGHVGAARHEGWFVFSFYPPSSQGGIRLCRRRLLDKIMVRRSMGGVRVEGTWPRG